MAVATGTARGGLVIFELLFDGVGRFAFAFEVVGVVLLDNLIS